ncbi:MAG: hypothetical protein COA78_27880 [Blastopirellula sp.]|nr:MAG: hypothetical protein COA78_27880 [Blastopirellula sp.]
MADHDKTLLILDMDETLIHASEKRLEPTLDCKVGPYFVYRRPFLDNFLLKCQQGFRLAVWSSSSADYLQAVLQATIPSEIKFEFAWSRERCTQRFDGEWQQYYYLKDLKKIKRLGYDLDRVLIVDDTPKKVERNYGNAIYIKPFYGSEIDKELKLLSDYLDSLRYKQNIRCIEKRNWRSCY